MKKRLSVFTAALLSAGVLASAAELNEIRIDNTGTDEEYFEIKGTNGENLSGMTLVVIGDGTGGSGVIENVIPLTGSIGADGLYLVTSAAYEAGTLIKADHPSAVADQAGVTFTFENSDNLTFLLVTGFSGAAADDLDTNDDGTLDTTPWTTIVDSVALLEETAVPPTATEYTYSANTVGPDGTFVPGHVYRDGTSGAWTVGLFDTEAVGATDTPDAVNPSTSSVSDWNMY